MSGVIDDPYEGELDRLEDVMAELGLFAQEPTSGSSHPSASLEWTLAELRERLDALPNVDPELRRGLEEALDTFLTAPSQAALGARRAIEAVTSYLNAEESGTLAEKIKGVKHPVIEAHLHFIRSMGNVASHQDWGLIEPRDALPALASLLRVIEWWQETA